MPATDLGNALAAAGMRDQQAEILEKQFDQQTAFSSVPRANGLARPLNTVLGNPSRYNVKSSNTIKLRNAMKRTDRNARIAFLGPSTTRGQITGGGTGQGPNSWLYKLAAELNAIGINAGADNLFADGGSWGTSNTVANVAAGDSRITFSGGATLSGAVSTLGGLTFVFPTAVAGLAFTPVGQVTKFDIYSRDAGAGRNFTWAIDAGGTTQINGAATNTLRKDTVSAGALGAHTLNLAWVAGQVALVGFEGYNDTAGRTQLSLMNFGISGAQSSAFINNTDAAVSPFRVLEQLLPDVVFIDDIFINDWRNSINLQVAIANVNTLVDKCIAVGAEPYLITPLFDNIGTGLTANQQAYSDALYDIADSKDIALWDYRSSVVSFAAANALGHYSDTVHRSILGHSVKGMAGAEFIKAVRSL